MGADFGRQLFAAPQPLWLAGSVLLVLALLPGKPKAPFLLLAAGAGGAAWRLGRRAEETAAPPDEAPQPREDLESLLRVE
ncbi:flagellar biosynthesis protein FlhA, partial [Corynebacterium diphtheriae]|uniref:flagellar biosynthesis protein FlhA n=1 Tax=Corynebacterium diphtheriae TaxID=1717 RepID=UPI000D4A571A